MFKIILLSFLFFQSNIFADGGATEYVFDKDGTWVNPEIVLLFNNNFIQKNRHQLERFYKIVKDLKKQLDVKPLVFHIYSD